MEGTPLVSDFRPDQPIGSVLVSPEELAGVAEIANVLKVSRATAARYVERDDFPEPIGVLARGRVWKRRDVERWATRTLPLPRPGRPPKASG
jgi:prophage regulatory protein